MNIFIDLSGDNAYEDLTRLRDCYQALEAITEADARKYSDQLMHASTLLALLNDLHRQVIEQVGHSINPRRVA